jgi:aminomethyltransferase
VFVNGAPSGNVCSGTMSPSCGQPIGTCYVPTAHAVVGNHIEIDQRGKRVTATIAEMPFWKHGSHR